MDFNNLDILQAALEYRKRGMSIIPIKRGTKQPVGKWKQCQSTAADEGQIRKWFSNGECFGPAVVLGAVSGGLACRDFDSLVAYDKWKTDHRDLAEILPTVKTNQGYHVYFLCPGCRTKNGDDGELRGEGAICLLPPSIHPEGTRYQWIIPLPDGTPIPQIDPAEAGLTPFDEKARERFVTEEAEETEESDESEEKEKPTLVESAPMKQFWEQNPQLDSPECREAMENAIVKTLPQEPGQRDKKLFEFARYVRAILKGKRLALDRLRPLAQEWYQRALPVIRTKDFETTWYDFRYGWAHVKIPKGEMLKMAMERAKTNPVVSSYEHPIMRDLLSLCRALQEQAGDEPFFLSTPMVKKLFGIDRMTAHRWLWILQDDGWIQTVEKGNEHKATRFRFIGRKPEDPGG